MAKKDKICNFLINIGAMTKEQCDEIFKLKNKGDTRLFGEIANEQGYVDKNAIRKYFYLGLK